MGKQKEVEQKYSAAEEKMAKCLIKQKEAEERIIAAETEANEQKRIYREAKESADGQLKILEQAQGATASEL